VQDPATSWGKDVVLVALTGWGREWRSGESFLVVEFFIHCRVCGFADKLEQPWDLIRRRCRRIASISAPGGFLVALPNRSAKRTTGKRNRQGWFAQTRESQI
jgi:hypothetical protein